MLNTWQFLKGNQLQSFPSASDLLHALFHRIAHTMGFDIPAMGHWFGQGKNPVTEWVDSGASIMCLYIVFYNIMNFFVLIYTYLLFNISCSYHLSDTQLHMYFFCWCVINIHSFIHSFIQSINQSCDESSIYIELDLAHQTQYQQWKDGNISFILQYTQHI